ncbi:TPA: hypothetical protein ACNU17_003068 [Aeromonas salmonicida subsp. pectinolytica]
MLEPNFVKWLVQKFSIPVYAFSIPDNAPTTAWCYVNAGRGTATNYHDGSEIVSRTIRLTKSSKNIEKIFDDSTVHKYIKEASSFADFKILSARVTNQNDLFDEENQIYERTYSISIKYKE